MLTEARLRRIDIDRRRIHRRIGRRIGLRRIRRIGRGLRRIHRRIGGRIGRTRRSCNPFVRLFRRAGMLRCFPCRRQRMSTG
jgi:hypothetical protein